MIENTPKVTDLAKCMGDYSLITLDVEKLDAVIKVLREVAGGESDSTKTKKEQILDLRELIQERLTSLHARLETGGGSLSEEERIFVARVPSIKDRLVEEVKKIDDRNIEIFKSSSGLGNNVDELYIKRAITYANDLRRSKIKDSSDRPKDSMIIDTLDGPVHKKTIENSSRCYDTAFRLVTGKHYSSLLDIMDNNGIEAVTAEVNRVAAEMFEGLKAYLIKKHGEGAVLHLDQNVKNYWIDSFKEELIRKLND